jgi:hypothetical protein
LAAALNSLAKPDIPLPDIVGKVHGGPYMWIAPKGHYEYCHIDADDGLLFILVMIIISHNTGI